MKYYVHLSDEQRQRLRKLICVGEALTRTLTHARILLKADQNPEAEGRAHGTAHVVLARADILQHLELDHAADRRAAVG